MENSEKDKVKQRLCEMSVDARARRESLADEAMESGDENKAMSILATPLNDFIIDMFYNPEQDHKFNTFRGWLNENMCVERGQKGYVIWGHPIRAEHKNELKEVQSVTKFFPISYIFRDDQVKELTK